MSNFKTTIAIDINDLGLPPGSTVNRILSDGNKVSVYWSNETLKSPYSFDIEYTQEQLKAGEIPAHVTPPAIEAAPPPAKKSVDKHKKKGEKAS